MNLRLYTLIFVLFCLQNESAHGGLVQEFFGKVHKVREDIGSALHIGNQNDNQHDNIKSAKNTTETTTKLNEIAQENPNVENNSGSNAKTMDKISFEESDTNQSNKQASSTTERGREIFNTVCVTGYIRTPDGRCKPTF